MDFIISVVENPTISLTHSKEMVVTGTIVYVNDVRMAEVYFTSDPQTQIDDIRSQMQTSYVHTQSTPATTWTITHNLNRFPSVTIVDTTDSEVVGDVHYKNANEITLTFSRAIAGKAFFN